MNSPDKTGLVPGGYGLRLRAIDMAKLGQLHLQLGRWQDKQIISSDWVRQATSDQTGTGYGYYWWTALGEGSAYAARGVRGQMIYIDPKRQTVFVIVSDLPPDNVGAVMRKFTDELLPKAITDELNLPANPTQHAFLVKELKLAADYVPEHRRGLPPGRLPQLPNGK